MLPTPIPPSAVPSSRFGAGYWAAERSERGNVDSGRLPHSPERSDITAPRAVTARHCRPSAISSPSLFVRAVVEGPRARGRVDKD
jgi:hypothetical protein